MESKGDQRKRQTTSRLVGGGFDKQKILHRRLVLGCCKMSKSPHLTTKILKVYIEALTEFSHMYHPDDLSNTLLSQVTPSVGIVGGMYIPRTGKGARRLQLLRSSSRVNHWSCPLNDCRQQRPTSTKYHKHISVNRLTWSFKSMHWGTLS